jgi:hypothetical protein
VAEGLYTTYSQNYGKKESALSPVLQKDGSFVRKARDLLHWLLLMSNKITNVQVN